MIFSISKIHLLKVSLCFFFALVIVRSNSLAHAQDNIVSKMKQLTVELEKDPNNARAAFDRGKIFLQIGEPRLAIADFTTSIIHRPEVGVTYAWRGEAKLILGDASYLKDFNKAVEISSKDPECYIFRAKAFLKVNNIQGAIKDLRLARQLSSKKEAEIISRMLQTLDGQ